MSSTIKSPEELIKLMGVIEYGWMDKQFNKYYTFDEWFDKVYFHPPVNTIKYKIGTCYEQTLFEHYIFSKYFSYEIKMIHVQQFFVSNHSFLMFKKDDKWYHFEHSFFIYRGIHGPFNNLNELIKPLKRAMIIQSKKENTYKNKGFKITEMNPDLFKKPLNAKQFLDRVGYDWSKQEKTI